MNGTCTETSHKLHTELTFILNWHSYWTDILTELTFLLSWHSYWADILTELTFILNWHSYWTDIPTELTFLLNWHSVVLLQDILDDTSSGVSKTCTLHYSTLFSLNSIYFQISIYTWQHTSIQIHGKWIGKQVT